MRVIILATLLLLSLRSCFSRAGVITLVSESEPLTVKVDPGTEVVDWIWFQGPYRNSLVNGPKPPPGKEPKDIIVWQIHPASNGEYYEFASADKIPIITYGRVPEGWQQKLPLTGSPPPLLEGYVYTVNAVTFKGPRPRELCVYVNKGRLELYAEQGGSDSLCGRNLP